MPRVNNVKVLRCNGLQMAFVALRWNGMEWSCGKGCVFAINRRTVLTRRYRGVESSKTCPVGVPCVFVFCCGVRFDSIPYRSLFWVAIGITVGNI